MIISIQIILIPLIKRQEMNNQFQWETTLKGTNNSNFTTLNQWNQANNKGKINQNQI